MLMMKAGVFRPTRIVSLRKIGGRLTGIEIGADGSLTIGATTPLAALEHSAEVARLFPVITRTCCSCRTCGCAMGFVGGALARRSRLDLPPTLVAAAPASAATVGPGGERKLTVEDLLTGYYETALEKNELITEVHVPAQGPRRAAYMKFTANCSAEDWPAVGVAVLDQRRRRPTSSVSATVVASRRRPTKATRLSTTPRTFSLARMLDDKTARRAAGRRRRGGSRHHRERDLGLA